jgi:hypothetical protein
MKYRGYLQGFKQYPHPNCEEWEKDPLLTFPEKFTYNIKNIKI